MNVNSFTRRARPARAVSRSGLVVVVCLMGGCAGGRLTVFDPLARSMSRHNATSGRQAIQQDNDESAERHFRAAIRLDARNGDAYAGLARILAARGDDPGAAEAYRSAVKHAPNNPNYAAELGECLGNWASRSLDRRSLTPAAMRAFRHARALSPGDAALALRHGVCARRLVAYADALEALREAVQLSPESPEIRIELAAVYEAIGDGVSARRESAEAERLAGTPATPIDRTAIAGDVED